jgi:hypothetical protein
MITEVVMQRRLFDSEIRQQSKTGFFSANDLVLAGNSFRALNKMKPIVLQDWLNRETTKEFIQELESQLQIEVKKATRGRYATTWLHPYLFIDLALTISPKLKIEVYSWLFDELLKYRNESGDSYKKMTGALFVNTTSKSQFSKGVKATARLIKNACQVKDWETANQEQLKLRDRIHENIALLCDVLKDNNQAVRLGILKTLEDK